MLFSLLLVEYAYGLSLLSFVLLHPAFITHSDDCTVSVFYSNPHVMALWRDTFWKHVLLSGNGMRHKPLTEEEYSSSIRDNETEGLFRYTPEYFAQNKLIAENIFRIYNLVVPMGVWGGPCPNELRSFTHRPCCQCYYCLTEDHKEEIEEDLWEKVRLHVSKKGKFYMMSWKEKQEIITVVSSE